VTYAHLSSENAPARHAQALASRRTFVVLDEVHHAGDSLSWGEGVREAFAGAARRLLLSGSPWRSDVNPIPFVTYSPDPEGVRRSRADYTYGYGEALRDSVVRPVVFLAYSGSARWRHRDGSELEATLSAELTRDVSSRALRTALDPKSEWTSSVLRSADSRLTEVRALVPDAGGLVLASNATHARAYAKLLSDITGVSPTVVLSEDAGSSKLIEEFASDASKRWLVAVRMVSEGVDVPRLAVMVYATNASTALFFTQAVGRVVRARGPEETATVFLPAVPSLLRLSAEVETQRDHALVVREAEPEDELAAANRSERASSDLEDVPFEALDASAHFERAIVNGVEFGPSAETRDAAAEHVIGFAGVHEVAGLVKGEGVPLHRQLSEARKLLAAEVSAWAAETGRPHAELHAWLRGELGGPAVASATLEEVLARTERAAYERRPKVVVRAAEAPAAREQMSLFG
jgi:superfamily II DNA or RNA helicase